MILPGKIVLCKFPFTDANTSKLRPALIIQKLPGKHEDFLICMISSRLYQVQDGFDEIVDSRAQDFLVSGLKVDSVVRISRLAVVNASILAGSIGAIAPDRLVRIREKISRWICE